MPLVLFTAVGVAGGGIGATGLIRAALSRGFPYLTGGEGIALSVLLGLGFLLSVGHLGKPLRGPLALRGLGRSPLSNEILALGVAVGGALLGVALPSEHPLQWVCGAVAGLGSVAFLLFVGAVYHLPGRLTWRGPTTLHPLVMGVAWGLLLALGVWGAPAPPGLPQVFWIALLIDGLLGVYRALALERAKGRGEVCHPPVFRLRGVLWGTRIGLSLVLTPLALMAGSWPLAVSSLSLALLLDRFAFYALAVRETTESEVARVEGLL